MSHYCPICNKHLGDRAREARKWFCSYWCKFKFFQEHYPNSRLSIKDFKGNRDVKDKKISRWEKQEIKKYSRC